MIYFKDVHKKFGDREILRGVNLHIVKGKTTVIFGVSGGGKSTIIKHIVGLLKPDSGTIEVDGVDITKLSPKEMKEMRKRIGFLFQSGALFDSMNVFDNVAFPLREHMKTSGKQLQYSVRSSLEMVGLKPDEVVHLFPHELSGGMRKRVGLARTIIMKPSILLYDEPTSGLDPVSSNLITELIRHLQNELGVTSILISHDINESFKSGDYFAMLFEGKIIDYGNELFFRTSKNPVIRQFLSGSSRGPIKFR
ncbi:MAG TPA: ABC transporter ATP-binding protein [Campylobacterales bacterium]|nr:ABC transporter ATP-binding protein [Campylobacterales bacterium]